MLIPLIAAVSLLTLLAVIWLGLRLRNMLGSQLEEKHRAMLVDMHDGLNKLGDRLNAATQDSSERLRVSVAQELNATRDAMQALRLAQTENLTQSREALLEKLNTTFETLNKAVEARLDLISGKVSERLDEGFKKTNETFVNVMARLATIDEAQKKIDGLTTNMVSLQELLGDKRSRGAFGEVQLEGLVRNLLPEAAFEFQYSFSNGTRVDCVLKLPEPTGMVAVDSKFPLENYERMFAEGADRTSPAIFKAGVKKHVDDIASKYIIANETSDGAVMFIPAEAVFAEIHAHHRDIVDYAQKRRVWIVSPTTLMAVLNTARAVLKDTETRKQVHIIQDELGKLGKDFVRFDERMKKLADHIRQASKDVDDVHISSKKITDRFAKIEAVELAGEPGLTALPSAEDEQ
ncbi:MAG: DNA recombination protein RmuC [Methylophilaceae bacterium]